MEEKNTVEVILRKRSILQQQLIELIQLKEEAFKVFDPSQRVFNGIIPWENLCDWKVKHPGLYLQDAEVIRTLFLGYRGGELSHDRFCEVLSESKQGVEDYIKKLEKEMANCHKELEEKYDDFFSKNSEGFDFIFAMDTIKSLILNFLQS